MEKRHNSGVEQIIFGDMLSPESKQNMLSHIVNIMAGDSGSKSIISIYLILP